MRRALTCIAIPTEQYNTVNRHNTITLKSRLVLVGIFYYLYTMTQSTIYNIAIFASGNGSNAENIIRHFSDGHAPVKVSLIVCNRPRAKVIQRGENHDIPVTVMTRAEINDRDTMLNTLRQYGISHIILAGFMIMLPNFLIQAYPDRIINVHPSLLPKYGGKGMYGRHVHEAVYAARETETGITIHYVNEEYDKGEIIFQAAVRLTADDTPESIEDKIHLLEKAHFPQVIESAVTGTVY